MSTLTKPTVVVLAAALALVASWRTSGGGSWRPASALSHSSTPGPTVDRGAFSGRGDLAFVSEGGLWVLDGTTGALIAVASPARQATDPQFSPSGNWLSYSLASGQVWLARSDGRAPRVVGPGAGGRWLPGGELLAGNVVWHVSASGSLSRVANAPAGLAAWSFDGGRYAFVSDDLTFTKASTGLDRLQVSSTLTGKRTTWYQSRVSFTKSSGAQGNFLDSVFVLPHEEGILFTLDPDRSASLAADGVNLYEIRGPGAQPKKLGIMVGDTVALGRDGTFAFTNGPDRYAWLTKTLETCSAAKAECMPVGTASGELSFDPSWSPDGSELAFVQAPSNSLTTNFYQSTVAQWYAAHSLWVLRPDTASPSRIKTADGASVPVWSADGKSLLYEANDALWLLPTLSSKPHFVASPLFTPDDWPSYYGQIDWSDQFAWRS